MSYAVAVVTRLPDLLALIGFGTVLVWTVRATLWAARRRARR